MEASFNPEKAKRAGQSERSRLKKELRQEKRGTIRELRRDNAFIAAQTQGEDKAKDDARKAKTKELMSLLRGQEAEYQRYQRTKHFKR